MSDNSLSPFIPKSYNRIYIIGHTIFFSVMRSMTWLLPTGPCPQKAFYEWRSERFGYQVESSQHGSFVDAPAQPINHCCALTVVSSTLLLLAQIARLKRQSSDGSAYSLPDVNDRVVRQRQEDQMSKSASIMTIDHKDEPFPKSGWIALDAQPKK